HRASRPPAPPEVRPRRGVRAAVGRHPAGDLPSEPPEHADRKADVADVRGDLRGGAAETWVAPIAARGAESGTAVCRARCVTTSHRNSVSSTANRMATYDVP